MIISSCTIIFQPKIVHPTHLFHTAQLFDSEEQDKTVDRRTDSSSLDNLLIYATTYHKSYIFETCFLLAPIKVTFSDERVGSYVPIKMPLIYNQGKKQSNTKAVQQNSYYEKTRPFYDGTCRSCILKKSPSSLSPLIFPSRK